MSVSCLVVANTDEIVCLNCIICLSPISLPTPLRSSRLCFPRFLQLIGRITEGNFTQRLVVGDFFFASPVSDSIFFSPVNQLNHYYEGSDSCHSHLRDRSPHLLQLTFLTFRSQPLGRPSYRFIRQHNVTDDFQASSTPSRLAALPCRIGFVILRTALSLPVALHPISQ